MSDGGAITTSVDPAATSSGGDQSAEPEDPIEPGSALMQNAIECFIMQQGESSQKRKRKAKEFPGYETSLPFPVRRRPRSLPPPTPPQAHGSSSSVSLSSFNHTIDAIKAKHGDIDKNCILKSEWMRKLNLCGICNVLREMEKIKLDDIDYTSLKPLYEVTEDLEKLCIDVKWLIQRLDEIKEVIRVRDEAKVFANEKRERMKKVEVLQTQIANLKNLLVAENETIDELNVNISSRTSTLEDFKSRPVTDGLI